MKLVSIITINYNNSEGLLRTLTSVKNQNTTNYELIVIDGGSLENDLLIINSFKSIISYTISEKDKGVYDAMNKGIKQATGDFLIFMNSGDAFYENDTLQKFEDLKMLHQQYDVIYGDVNAVGLYSQQIIQQPFNLSRSFFLNHTLNHQATFIHKKLFDEFGLYSTHYKISSDYEFFLKCYLKYPKKFSYHPFVVCDFYMDGISQNSNNFKLVGQEREVIHQLYFTKKELIQLKKLEPKKKFSKYVVYEFFNRYKVTSLILNSLFSVYRKIKK